MPPPWLRRAGAGWVLRCPPPSSGSGSTEQRGGCLASAVQDRDLARAAEYAAGQGAMVLRVCQDGDPHQGDRRRPHHRPRGKLGTVPRPAEFAEPLPSAPQPKNGKVHAKPVQISAPVREKLAGRLGAGAPVSSPARISAPSPGLKFSGDAWAP